MFTCGHNHWSTKSLHVFQEEEVVGVQRPDLEERHVEAVEDVS